MDMTKLKPLEKRIQIISAIEKASAFGGDIWQSGPAGRKILQIYQASIDVKFDKVVLKAHGLMDLDQTAPIFVRLCYRNLIFRLDPLNYNVLGEKLICEYPHEARALEQRKGERYVLPFNSDISLSLTKATKFMGESVLDLEVRIVDVSQWGFGILISRMNKSFLGPYDHFWIKSIDQRALPNPIFGTVSYVAPKATI